MLDQPLAGLAGSEGGAAKPQTVADRIAAILREAIAAGTLAAGTALRQDDLAARFGFSRMPIRDALRLLEAEGIVSIHPTRGAFVAPMDATEIAEIFAVRELLEREALRLALPKLSDADLDRAEAILDRLDAEPDVGRWGALNRDFHLTLYRPCGNARLLDLIEAQHRAADRYVRVLLASLDYSNRSQHEHRKLLAACRKRNEEKGLGWLRRHLSGSEKLIAAIR
ncbi:MAG TPA: GntR family transcriptional regulator [Kiloniellales bacterium]|nr:GntR family transcriptional regulator [Kiloniellales bacterium]